MLLILPDAMLEDVMDKLIQAEVLLVLVNHPSPAIQRGVIQVRGVRGKKSLSRCEGVTGGLGTEVQRKGWFPTQAPCNDTGRQGESRLAVGSRRWAPVLCTDPRKK